MPSTNARTLTTHLHELVSDCFTGLCIQTHEPQEALRDLTSLCRNEGWRLGTWDCDRGMSFPLEPIQMPGVTDTQDPLPIIRFPRDPGYSPICTLEDATIGLRADTAFEAALLTAGMRWARLLPRCRRPKSESRGSWTTWTAVA